MDTGLLFVLVLTIHVVGAIFGFGPSVAFAILGPMAGKAGPNGGVAIMETIIAIEKKIIFPVAVAVQPLSGLALIFLAGYNTSFFSHYWLWIAILVYAFTFYLATFVQIPLIEKLIHLAKAGPPTPEFMAIAKKTQRYGPILTLDLLVIVILMVAKPGG
ncbi:MAG TPA: DUF2269 family protein [Candidatus Limnocylindria bacterium]|jgi:uncharacterized membrane protein